LTRGITLAVNYVEIARVGRFDRQAYMISLPQAGVYAHALGNPFHGVRAFTFLNKDSGSAVTRSRGTKAPDGHAHLADRGRLADGCRHGVADGLISCSGCRGGSLRPRT